MYEKRKKYRERKRNVRRAQAQCTESAAQCTEGAYLYAGRTKKRTEDARDHVPNPNTRRLNSIFATIFVYETS